ncbi:MAG: DNA-directed RNA polymerase subunit beta, partial [Candidatus Eiseniibacteriota bacterium]
MSKKSISTERVSFSKIDERWAVELPNFLDVQLRSFSHFLQADVPPEKRENIGLQEVFNSVFPISDAREMFLLEFVRYDLGQPKYSVDECQERDLIFSVPLKATLRLHIREEKDGEKREKEIIEQEVYLGELPVITEKGTFIINGAERVIVSQLHRSPGVFFDEMMHPKGKKLLSARIIPYRGSWVEFSMDVNDIMYVHIDRKRKLPVSVLMRALGFTTDRQILELFYEVSELKTSGAGSVKEEDLVGRVAAEDVVDVETGEILLECNEEITDESARGVKEAGIKTVKVFAIPNRDEADVIRNTLKKDKTKTEDEALAEIYKQLRPGDPPRLETARDILNRLFFNPKRYELAKVGRYKLNQKMRHEYLLGGPERLKALGLTAPSDDEITLCKEDFIAIIQYLMWLRLGMDHDEIVVTTDDIDHLGNRRVRSVGELLANQFNLGLARMARIIRERI